MGSDTFRFFRIEAGELLDLATAIQDEHYAVARQFSAFAKRSGATSYNTSGGGVFAGGGRAKLIGLGLVNPMPAGWKISGRGGNARMVPRKDAKDLRAEFDALPTMPNTRGQIAEAIGWSTDLESKRLDRKQIGILPMPQLIWTGKNFCILLPMNELFGGTTAETVENAMAFPVPAGCVEISEAQWELISAQAKVARETAKAA